MPFPQESIFGVTLWVVSTIVFPFVLFGVINGTGVGFRIGFMVNQAASNLGGDLAPLFQWGSFELFTVEDLTLFISPDFKAVVVIKGQARTLSPGRTGAALAQKSGDLLAGVITGDRVNVDLAPSYAPQRFG